MTEDESLSSTLSAIFRRKGGKGHFVCLFDELDPAIQGRLLHLISLHNEELPVIGGMENADAWVILTTRRLAWGMCRTTHILALRDICDIAADFSALKAHGIAKRQMRQLQLKTVDTQQYTVESEEGAPLFGIWNALLFFAKRNRNQ